MPKKINSIKILISSPTDLQNEHKVVDAVIKELNISFCVQNNIVLQLVDWETNVFPGVSSDPQAVINSQIPSDYDILIVMFWSRIGTSTPRYPSGTIEEFESAYDRWKKDNNSVSIMIYFKNDPIPVESIDPSQLAKLLEFKASLSDKGILFKSFTGSEDLSASLRVHLISQIQNILKREEGTNGSIDRPDGTTTKLLSINNEHFNLENEIGFLDLIEVADKESEKVKKIINHFVTELIQLNVDTQSTTDEITSVVGDNNAKFAAYKHISNKQAEIMANFVARLNPEISILGDSLFKALEAYGYFINFIPDFGKGKENYDQFLKARKELRDLRSVLNESKTSISEFRLVADGLPRITTQFNRSKRDLVNLLDNFLSTFDRAENMLAEIDMAGKKIDEDWLF